MPKDKLWIVHSFWNFREIQTFKQTLTLLKSIALKVVSATNYTWLKSKSHFWTHTSKRPSRFAAGKKYRHWTISLLWVPKSITFALAKWLQQRYSYHSLLGSYDTQIQREHIRKPPPVCKTNDRMCMHMSIAIAMAKAIAIRFKTEQLIPNYIA